MSVALLDVAGAGHACVRQGDRETGVRAVHGELPVDEAGVAAQADVAGGGCGEQGAVDVDGRLGRVHRLDAVQGLDEDHRPGERGQQNGAGLQCRAAGRGAGPAEADRRAAAVEDGAQQRRVRVGVGAVQVESMP
ncbi:hypothetical protein [Streptomyces sp. 4N124]|uniref:hypothetical protein n=1 Tax=Streptomyces sp. 4N124 TaxID=3457420 RepID=UPI003FD1663A